ncbi:MAG: NADH-quinone oxidoreductase subunit J [Isosphaeraceae bacterium]|nr:NADH-quinone oxidoreductase subunit J [Isosphaeraceae bacterium]
MDTIAANDLLKAILVIVSGAIGTYLLLPHRLGLLKPLIAQRIGAGLVAIAILAFALLWRAPGEWIAGGFFYLFAITALAGAILTITSRSPVYSALWFASVILSTSGLFLLCGAQFLAAGTVIVYAGAIVVTFLFVIMLAQIEKQAVYDRSARNPARATFTSYLLLWSLIYALLAIQSSATSDEPHILEKRLVRGERMISFHGLPVDSRQGAVAVKAYPPTGRLPSTDARSELGLHVAGLGGTLFTDHLVSVELAGSLLFVALVGALAIASPKPPIRPGAVSAADPGTA